MYTFEVRNSKLAQCLSS